ncbi:CAP domain-containing protein [Cellvibrio sp. OA-2007]|uniref:CAP domain-containing protein n=1 Tax=Cellvibrio sp. OA-2007 TaxID=529823 RepID=UPI000B254F8B|nr:CAP domain-containing protein [Cellvibrio sp. OA-2007]
MNSLILLRSALLFASVTALISCGGGSGGGAATPPASNSSASNLATSSSSVSSIASSNSSSVVLTSSSAQSSITSSSLASLAAPQNIAAQPGTAAVTLSWNSVAGASGYRVYYASEANILINNIASFDDGTRVDNAISPRVINNLRNGQTYYFVVTAINGNQESIASAEVSATPNVIDLAKQPNAQEVLVVELVNRARANPDAEAARLGIGLNDGITGTAITNTPKPPLAHNLLLIESARLHSQWMLDADIFSHTGNNNSTPHERMQAVGYSFTGSWTSGENIAWGGTTGSSINLTSYAVSQHEGLFKSPGHRVNILNANFRELGVGQLQGYFMQDGRNYLSSMLTQNFARSGSSYFLTGVIYEDKNNNEFYDVGEGLSGINITINGKTYPAFNSGAYAIPLANGTYQLSITGAALGGPVYYSVQISNQNRKLDVIKTGANLRVVTP